MKTIPLDPKRGGGMCILPAALKKADLIVSTTGAFVSGAIRVGTVSPVSHAMLYVGGGHVIEAVGEGVRRVPLKTAFHEASLAVGYRMVGLSEQEMNQIASFAERQVGKPYDTVGVAGAGIARNRLACAAAGLIVCVVAKNGLVSSDSRFFCSELVLAAFAAANRPITTQNPSTSIPHDIPKAYSVGKLEYVGHLVLRDS